MAAEAKHAADGTRGNGVRVVSCYGATVAESLAAGTPAVARPAAEERCVLEVPHEQYDGCLEELRRQMTAGLVAGVTDPAQATAFVQQGSVTYLQAKRLAESGRVAAVLCDDATQVVRCRSPFGLSFVVSYARARWNGNDVQVATRAAIESGLTAGQAAVLAGVLSAEQLRVQARSLQDLAAKVTLKRASSTLLKHETVQRITVDSVRNSTHRAVAQGAVHHLPKILRGNLVTGAVMTVAASVPDFYRAVLERSISWRQLTKNISVNVAGVVAGGAGWLGGAAVGATVGSVVPLVGTAAGGFVGGLVGAIGGGLGGSKAAKQMADRLVTDDQVVILQSLQEVFQEKACGDLLTEVEAEHVVSDLRKTLNLKWFRKLFQQTNRGQDVSLMRSLLDQQLNPCFAACVQNRQAITVPLPADVCRELERVAEAAAVAGTDAPTPVE